jgi:exo-1,4-beta-D-glucosaminidase
MKPLFKNANISLGLSFAFFLSCLTGHSEEHKFALENVESTQGTTLRAQPIQSGWTIQRNANSGKFAGQTFESSKAGTVAGILADNRAVRDSEGNYLDPYKGYQLKQWPGFKYMRSRFDKRSMPSDSPFRSSWTYKKSINIPPFDPKQEHIWIDLEGLNYKAQMKINGQSVPSKQFVGPYRKHRVDISQYVKDHGGDQVEISFEMEAPGPGDLAYSWIDWHATPPDKMMGVIEEPVIEKTGHIRLVNPFVKTRYDAQNDIAHLSVELQLENTSGVAQKDVEVEVVIDGKKLRVKIPYIPVTKDGRPFKVKLDSKNFPQLVISNPTLWWPKGLGDPNRVKFEASVFEASKDKASSKIEKLIGLREAQSYLDNKGDRRFKVNGKEFTVRGMGWSSDFMFNESPEKKAHKLKMISDMGYNSIRQEGTIENDAFYEKADQMGIMVLAGLACCGQWEASKDGKLPWSKTPTQTHSWNEEKYNVATRSVEDILTKLRSHPSFLVWFNGSDFAPHAELEERYKPVYQETLGEKDMNQIISRASKGKYTRASSILEDSGTKMQGPYSHVSPEYWYDLRTPGSADGFHSELGPGVSIAHLASLAEMSEKPLTLSSTLKDCYSGELINSDLKDHAGMGVLGELKHFYRAMCARYGQPKDIQEFIDLAQIMNFEDHRAMNEAFGQHKKGQASGHIHWMGMNAWPSMRWNLFDYHLRQGGSYYGAKKGNDPLHLQYNYFDDSVHLVNHSSKSANDLTAELNVYDQSSQKIMSRNLGVGSSSANSSEKLSVDNLSEVIQRGSGVKFVNLVLKDKNGTPVSSNFYWVPAQKAQFNRSKGDGYRTPESRYSDMVSLSRVPQNAATVKELPAQSTHNQIQFEISNSNSTVSLFNLLTVRDQETRQEIWPQLWSDNMISLAPGETRTITLTLQDGQTAEDIDVSSRTLHRGQARQAVDHRRILGGGVVSTTSTPVQNTTPSTPVARPTQSRPSPPTTQPQQKRRTFKDLFKKRRR